MLEPRILRLFISEKIESVRTRIFQRARIQELCEPERIVAEQTINGKVEYLVKWKNYADSEDTWEPLERLRDCEHLLRNFQRVSMILHSRSDNHKFPVID